MAKKKILFYSFYWLFIIFIDSTKVEPPLLKTMSQECNVLELYFVFQKKIGESTRLEIVSNNTN